MIKSLENIDFSRRKFLKVATGATLGAASNLIPLEAEAGVMFSEREGEFSYPQDKSKPHVYMRCTDNKNLNLPFDVFIQMSPFKLDTDIYNPFVVFEGKDRNYSVWGSMNGHEGEFYLDFARGVKNGGFNIKSADEYVKLISKRKNGFGGNFKVEPKKSCSRIHLQAGEVQSGMCRLSEIEKNKEPLINNRALRLDEFGGKPYIGTVEGLTVIPYQRKENDCRVQYRFTEGPIIIDEIRGGIVRVLELGGVIREYNPEYTRR